MQYEYNDVEKGGGATLSKRARGSLQCNILFAARTLFSRQIFVRFESASDFRRWLDGLPPIQPERAAHADRLPEGSLNLLFTYEGLKLLEMHGKFAPSAFQEGPRSPARLAKLRDADPRTWEDGHRRSWHAALLVHGDQPDLAVQQFIGSLDPKSYMVEYGQCLDAQGAVLTNPAGTRYNAFGYQEGLSMNVYEGELAAPSQYYDPRRKLSTLLAEDPFAPGCFGSYFVFRKYRFDVGGFETRIKQMAERIRNRPEQAGGTRVPADERYPALQQPNQQALERTLRAWVLGREENGDPLSNVWNRADQNDFRFEASDKEPDGQRCPFHAHISKMNPRGRTGDEVAERKRAIARRGMQYGSRHEGSSGALFWCAQGSIEQQFEYVMETWANCSKVDIDAAPNPDLDNFIGRPSPDRFERVSDAYPAGVDSRYGRWKQSIDVDTNLWDHVVLRGSEYFFAPSLEGIANMLGRKS